MTTLITGSSGFIGRHLVSRLQNRGEDVVGLDIVFDPEVDQPNTSVYCDITNDLTMKLVEQQLLGYRSKVDSCIHLAAVASPRIAAGDQRAAWDVNVRGTHNVLKLCNNVGIRKIVFASSAHVYGISPKYLPTNESHPLALLDTYTTTKIAGEMLCQLFHSNYNLSTTVLRLFNAYGPGQSEDYFIGVKLKQARGGGPITLMNGNVTKDWIFIDDASRAFEAALHTEYVGAINVGTGVETSLEYIANRIGRFFNLPVKIEEGRDNSPTRMLCDFSLAKGVLSWTPNTPLNDGLDILMKD